MSITMPVPPAPPAPPQSSFVTIVAWIFIALSGFGVVVTLLQNIMVQTMFPSVLPTPPNAGAVPPLFAFIVANFKLVILIPLVIAAACLVVSIGLLKRRNWARILFIAMLAVGILWSIVGIAIQIALASSFGAMFAGLPAPPGAPDFAHGFRTMLIVMQIFGALMSIGFMILYGWIIKRLVSPAIVAEFA